jgi:hypothetical protein
MVCPADSASVPYNMLLPPKNAYMVILYENVAWTYFFSIYIDTSNKVYWLR